MWNLYISLNYAVKVFCVKNLHEFVCIKKFYTSLWEENRAVDFKWKDVFKAVHQKNFVMMLEVCKLFVFFILLISKFSI